MPKLTKQSPYYPQHWLDKVAYLTEEVGEVLQQVGKGERFGWYNEWDGKTNYFRFIEEVQDLRQAIEIVLNSDGPPPYKPTAEETRQDAESHEDTRIHTS